MTGRQRKGSRANCATISWVRKLATKVSTAQAPAANVDLTFMRHKFNEGPLALLGHPERREGSLECCRITHGNLCNRATIARFLAWLGMTLLKISARARSIRSRSPPAH